MVSLSSLEEFLRQVHVTDSAGRKSLWALCPESGKIGHVVYVQTNARIRNHFHGNAGVIGLLLVQVQTIRAEARGEGIRGLAEQSIGS
jgi:hypothetical protein